MKTITKNPVAIVCIFTWIGFVCAISFMESWLKFRAPGISISLGLGIGRLVFGVLNKVEWIFAIAILVNLLTTNHFFRKAGDKIFLLSVIILLIQTFWLLPALDARAELHIKGLKVTASYLHFYFIGMEILKVTCLFITGVSFFKQSN